MLHPTDHKGHRSLNSAAGGSFSKPLLHYELFPNPLHSLLPLIVHFQQFKRVQACLLILWASTCMQGFGPNTKRANERDAGRGLDFW